MASTRHNNRKGGGRQRRISVRAVRREQPDLRKLSRALIQLALDQAETDAKRQHEGGAAPSEAADG